MSRIVNNAIYNIANTAFNIITPLITFPYLTRVINPSGIGKISWAESITNIFVLIASFGVAQYGIREISKIKNNEKLLKKFMLEIFILTCITSIGMFIIFLLLIGTIPYIRSETTLFLICSINVLLTPFWITWFYQGIERFDLITKRSLALKIIIISFFTLIVNKPEDYYKWTLLVTISNILGNLVFVYYASNFFNPFPLPKKLLSNSIAHFKPLLYFLGIAILFVLVQNIDKVILGFFESSETVGFYSTSIKFVRIFEILAIAIGTVLIPSISKFFSNYHLSTKNKTEIIRINENYLKVISFIGFPAILFLMIFSNEIIYYFAGDGYDFSAKLLIYLSPLLLINSLIFYYGYQILIPMGKEKTYLKIFSTIVVIMIISELITIPYFGVFGLVYSVLVTSLIGLALLSKTCFSYVPTNFLYLSYKYYLATFLTIPVCLLLKIYTNQNHVFYYFVLIILTAQSFYMILLYILREDFIISGIIAFFKKKYSK